MPLSQANYAALKTHVVANPAAAQFLNTNQYQLIADLYNVLAVPDFFVYRTDVTRAEIYHQTSTDGTTWNWTTYKNQGVPEQNAWTQMFMGDQANFSLPNLRSGVSAIFSGAGAPAAQVTHVLATAKRKARLGEKICAAGIGSSATPATMSFEGELTRDDIERILVQG